MSPIFFLFGALYAVVAGLGTLRVTRLPPEWKSPINRWLPWYHPARRTVIVGNVLNVVVGLLLMLVGASGRLG